MNRADKLGQGAKPGFLCPPQCPLKTPQFQLEPPLSFLTRNSHSGSTLIDNSSPLLPGTSSARSHATKFLEQLPEKDTHFTDQNTEGKKSQECCTITRRLPYMHSLYPQMHASCHQ